ncbi:MAG: hypothetical protein ACRD3T_07705 [Terriglobia bacterium]
MSIAKSVFHWERVVPVRFARAPDVDDPTVFSGPVDADAPDPDDRGFVSWTAHGVTHTAGSAVMPIGLDPSVDSDQRPKTRVCLIRQDIDESAPLFLTLESAGIVSIELPSPAPTALPATPLMMIKLRAQAAGSTHLEVRFGSAGGTIIHRLEVVVNPMIDVRMTAHVPTVNGALLNDPNGNVLSAISNRTDQQIFSFLEDVNKVFFPYGIRLLPDATVDRAGVLSLAHQGAVDDVTEFDRTMALKRVAHSVNAYFVPTIVEQSSPDPAAHLPGFIGGVGLTLVGNPGNFGLLVADFVSDVTAGSGTLPVAPHAIAHEVGHVLNLINDPSGRFVHVNREVNPSDGTEHNVRDDIVSRRRLLYAFTDFGGTDAQHPYRDDVGYGDNSVGGMLSVKQLNNDPTDLEMDEVRRSAARL